MSQWVSEFVEGLKVRSPSEPEFYQAVTEVFESLVPVMDRHPEFRRAKILERLVEPERAIMFRVPWVDDRGEVHVNRGYRVQFSSTLGPYKGGLRFHPSVNLGIIKFLGFEQIFKNALTTLPMGGGKGGSDFDPKGKSDAEVMRFCQSFMSELYRHIGPNTDVPAGDIGVGGREIGYMTGAYRKIVNRVECAITGKGVGWGGSLIRPEATGYGVVYFVQQMLHTRNIDLKDKRVLVSGSGNVAQYAVAKAIDLGARVLTMSDSTGYIIDEEGIDASKLEFILHLKNVERGRLKEYKSKYPKAQYEDYVHGADRNPVWHVKADVALPCATQNEISPVDADVLAKNGCQCVAEGGNMATTIEGVRILIDRNVMFAPGKAANAGGVAVSGLEMTQNAMRLAWTADEVDQRLQTIMTLIHNDCAATAERFGTPGNYLHGANIAGFLKVANAMIDLGVI